jgi:hypothetical protein
VEAATPLSGSNAAARQRSGAWDVDVNASRIAPSGTTDRRSKSGKAAKRGQQQQAEAAVTSEWTRLLLTVVRIASNSEHACLHDSARFLLIPTQAGGLSSLPRPALRQTRHRM